MKTVGSSDCFVMLLDIQGRGALLGGKADCYSRETLSAVGLCPDTDFFCLCSRENKGVTHTHTHIHASQKWLLPSVPLPSPP